VHEQAEREALVAFRAGCSSTSYGLLEQPERAVVAGLDREEAGSDLRPWD
jgi:hypothetical protein